MSATLSSNFLRIVTVALVDWLVVASPQFALAQWALSQAESSQLENYLQSLGLDDLLTEHLEQQTAQQQDLGLRRTQAARLLDVYAQQMMSGKPDQAKSIEAKCERLLQIYPGLRTSSIQIAMLHWKHLNYETDFNQWSIGEQSGQQKSELIGNWQDLKHQLTALNSQLEREYQEQVFIAQTSPGEQGFASEQLIQTEQLLLHSNYLLGWTSYFLGVLTPSQRSILMEQADDQFRNFLQIEPKKTLTQISHQWFDLSSDWNTRALIGLAMSQRGLKHPKQSQYCLDLIGKHSTDKRTRELRFVWDLNCRIHLSQFPSIVDVVKSYEGNGEASQVGRTAFWVATLNAALASRKTLPDNSQQLARSGLRGLVRDFQAPLIEDFLSKNELELTEDDFLNLWIGGYLDFESAKKANEPDRYRAVKSKLRQAIKLADPKLETLDVARCRYLIALIDLQQKNYENAAVALLEISQVVDRVDSELAAQSQWLAIGALSELCNSNTRFLIQANRAIDQMMNRFPGSSLAQQAEFEKTRINVARLDPESAINRLSRFGASNSNYASALKEIARFRFQAWLEAKKSNQQDESERLAELVAAEKDFRLLPGASSASKLKVMLLVIDALLRTRAADDSQLRARLDEAGVVAEQLDRGGEAYTEYRYHEFLFANRTGDSKRAQAEAIWLSEYAQGSRFERAALIALAQGIERELEATPNPTSEKLSEAVQVYQRLVDLLGDSAETLQRLGNARVAFARLAELKRQAGMPDQAQEMFETLNQMFPDHRIYLTPLADLYTDQQQYSKSIPIWQKLAAGVNPGSDDWYHAKYYLAVCLLRSGQQVQAKRLHEQTLRLSPDLPKIWRSRFDELSAQLQAP